MKRPSTVIAHLPLFVWLSPAFPVGGFAYSHGLEWAVEAGDVTDAPTLKAWISDLLEHGAARTDAILLTAAYGAAADSDTAGLHEVNDLALALAPSQERHLETHAQGTAFVATVRASWPCALLSLLPQGQVAYPVAVGVAAAGHAVPLEETLQAFILAFCGNLVSAAVRLNCIGQTDAQKVIAACCAQVPPIAAFAAAATLDDLGGFVPRADIFSMRHETQYSRLFRA